MLISKTLLCMFIIVSGQYHKSYEPLQQAIADTAKAMEIEDRYDGIADMLQLEDAIPQNYSDYHKLARIPKAKYLPKLPNTRHKYQAAEEYYLLADEGKAHGVGVAKVRTEIWRQLNLMSETYTSAVEKRIAAWQIIQIIGEKQFYSHNFPNHIPLRYLEWYRANK